MTSNLRGTNKIFAKFGGRRWGAAWIPIGEFLQTLKDVEIVGGCMWVDGILYVSGRYSFAIGTEAPNAKST
jgi:hypothetical protein